MLFHVIVGMSFWRVWVLFDQMISFIPGLNAAPSWIRAPICVKPWLKSIFYPAVEWKFIYSHNWQQYHIFFLQKEPVEIYPNRLFFYPSHNILTHATRGQRKKCDIKIFSFISDLFYPHVEPQTGKRQNDLTGSRRTGTWYRTERQPVFHLPGWWRCGAVQTLPPCAPHPPERPSEESCWCVIAKICGLYQGSSFYCPPDARCQCFICLIAFYCCSCCRNAGFIVKANTLLGVLAQPG